MTFTWVKFYNEMFLKIMSSYDAKSLAKVAYTIFPEKAMLDRDGQGKEFRLEEIDPCTFMARFNRKERDESRIAYCKKAKEVLGLSSEIPKDFSGIPIFQNMAYWFFPFKHNRKGHEFGALWSFARDLASGEVREKSFNGALESSGTGMAYLTTICFIVWPEKYLPLDKRTKQFLDSRDSSITKIMKGWREMENPFAAYRSLLDRVSSEIPGKTFAEMSVTAYEESRDAEVSDDEDDSDSLQPVQSKGTTFWVAGSSWKGDETSDKTEEFLREGVWRNGYSQDSGDKSVEKVKLAKPGDYIAIKSSSTKGPGRKISFLKVKAIGIITANVGDGTLKVDWKFRGPAFDVDRITYRKTFEPVNEPRFVSLIFAPVLGSVTELNVKQKTSSTEGMKSFDTTKPRNVIYWGPPGTGKTYQILKLQEQFEDTGSDTSLDQIVKWVQESTWWEVIAAAMIDIGKQVSVPELYEHEFIQLKFKESPTKNPKNTIWGNLQTHTVQNSTTVNYERRQEPLVVDKSEDTKWFLTNNWEEQLEDLVQDVQRLRGKSSSSVTRRYEMVTFHQSFSYEEFVEGIRPETAENGSTIRYDVKPGVFRRICQRALENPEKEYAILIDEINRGNISKIFGDLITLIEADKRIGQPHELTVTLPYSGIEFGVPENVHIIGTMNSVDRSIALVDMALRRRFEFISVRPNAMLIEPATVSGVNVRNVFSKLNQKISAVLGSEYQIGHSYFMGGKSSSVSALKSTWFGSILPLLQEYLFDDWSKLKALVGNFVVETEIETLGNLALARSTYGRFIEAELSDEQFVELMKALE